MTTINDINELNEMHKNVKKPLENLSNVIQSQKSIKIKINFFLFHQIVKFINPSYNVTFMIIFKKKVQTHYSITYKKLIHCSTVNLLITIAMSAISLEVF